MEFKVGQEVNWVHGEHHRIATVLEVNDEKVKLSGMTSNYWIKKETLIKKINRAYPVGRGAF